MLVFSFVISIMVCDSHIDSLFSQKHKLTGGLIPVKDEKLMFALIRASFNKRRKTLLNGISTGENLNFTKEQILSAFERCGFDPAVRGEKLSLEDFAKLADALTEA